jgi:hypothetical protein
MLIFFIFFCLVLLFRSTLLYEGKNKPFRLKKSLGSFIDLNRNFIHLSLSSYRLFFIKCNEGGSTFLQVTRPMN